MATSSASGPPLACSARADQPGRQLRPAARRGLPARASSAHSPVDVEPLGRRRRSRPSISPSVYSSSDQSSAAEPQVGGRALGVGRTRRAPAPYGAGTAATRPPASSSGGGWPASRTVGPVGGQVDA